MKTEIIKAMAKIPKDMVVMEAKKKMKEGFKYTVGKIERDVNNEMVDIMTMPQQIALELKKQSVHQSAMPFQKSFNDGWYYNQYDYFSEYYGSQQKRYTATPQQNLADVIWQSEYNMRNRRSADMYNNYKR